MMFSISGAAREAPGSIALIAGERRWTFAELAREVQGVLRMLETRFRDSEENSPIAFTASPEPAVLMLLYALMECGRPVAPLSPRITKPERDVLLAELGAVDVIEAVLPSQGDAHISAAHIDTNRARRDDPAREVDADRAAAFVFTAGSTGQPRAAVLSGRAFHASAAASEANLGWTAHDRWLLCMPLHHVGGLSIVTRSLGARRPIVLLPRFDPDDVIAAIRTHRVTLLSLVPAMLEQLLARGPDRGALASLRAVLVGGAAANARLVHDARAQGFPVLTTYGLTEMCSQVTTQGPADTHASPLRPSPSGTGDSGRPLPGVELRIAGGVIEVRGPMLFSGYCTGGRISPPHLHEGWFATGDLGLLDPEGRLYVEGRTDDLILTGGEKVNPSEVEAALLGHAGIAAACVFGIPDVTWGALVSAALVPSGGTPPPDHALRAHLQTRLAPWKQPRRVAWLSELPRNAAGKIDRAETARRAVPVLREIV